MPGPSVRSAMFLAVLVVGLCNVACDRDSPTSAGPVPEALTLTVETESIVFRHAPGDSVDPELQQAFHDWFTGLVGVEPPGRIQYHKYRDRGHMQSLVGREANGWADPPYDLHSIFRAHPHEAVHLYTYQVGRPSDFFNEGVAVAMQVDPRDPGSAPRWQGLHVHTRARAMLQGGDLRPLAEMVDTSSFRSIPEAEGYPVAGSFLRFLYERDGMDPVMAFFRDGSRDESLATIGPRFRESFGESLEVAEAAWHGFLVDWGG